ncbi:Uncharacterised protein [Mycobacteroides abscessus subsp. abscessus]|nr:Uncharacterised protein [Mycobacteroides abscessus subsp. abscessus]
MSNKKQETYISGVENANNAAQNILANERVINLQNAFENYKTIMENSVRTKAGNVNLLADDKLKGFVFEAQQKASFNIDAAEKGLFPSDIKASIGTDTLADGSKLSSIDTNRDIVIESTPSLRQKLGLENPTAKDYQAKVLKTESKTRKALDQYEANPVGPAEQVPEYARINENYRGKTVLAEERTTEQLMDDVRQAKKGTVEYEHKTERMNKLQMSNFGNAVKSGAIVGALTTTVLEIVDIVKNEKNLTSEQFEESVINIVKGTIDGGARSGVLYTAAQITGATGLRSVPILAGANALYDFTKDLYRFSKGDIDADDLLCNTVNNSYTSLGAFGGAQLGVSAAIGLGATIGTSVGPIGTVIGGAIGGLIGGIATGAVVSSAGKTAMANVRADIESALQATTLHPQMKQLRLIENMNQLSDREFSFKSLIPGYNIIGDLTEYNQRKKVLKQVRSDIREQKKNLDVRFARAQEELIAFHERRCQELEWQFKTAREQLQESYLSKFQDSLGLEFQEFQASYHVAFGNLELQFDELLKQESQHKQKIYLEEERRKSNEYIIQLLHEVSEEDNNVVPLLVKRLRNQLNNDYSLKGLSYIDKDDILALVTREAN